MASINDIIDDNTDPALEAEAEEAYHESIANKSENKDAKSDPNAPPEPGDDSPCNLIVKYLPDSIDEQGLLSLFSSYGEIVKHKLILDRASGRSKGYGFVKFSNEKSATEATKALNGYAVENKILRVHPANPMHQKNPVQQAANIYVAGLPKTFSKQDLFSLFSPYGNISESKILYDKPTGQSRGVGFVRFESYENGTAAIQALNGTAPDGCQTPLAVRFARVKAPNAMAMNARTASFPYQMQGYAFGAAQPNRFHGVRDFAQAQAPQQFQYQQIQGAQQYGVRMPQAVPQNQFSFGMGVDPYMMSGAYAQAQGQQPSDDAGLFVFHLPPTTDEQQLATLFSGYGTVLNAKVIRDPMTQQSKGYGFVNMGSTMEAQNAISALNGYQLGGKYLKVSFKRKN